MAPDPDVQNLLKIGAGAASSPRLARAAAPERKYESACCPPIVLSFNKGGVLGERSEKKCWKDEEKENNKKSKIMWADARRRIKYDQKPRRRRVDAAQESFFRCCLPGVKPYRSPNAAWKMKTVNSLGEGKKIGRNREGARRKTVS